MSTEDFRNSFQTFYHYDSFAENKNVKQTMCHGLQVSPYANTELISDERLETKTKSPECS